MSQQASPLTYEGILKLFEKSTLEFNQRMVESDEKFREEMAESRRAFDQQMAERRAESDRRQAESDRGMEKLRKQMGDIGVRIGNLVEHVIGGKNIVEQFQDLGYNVIDHSRDNEFGIRGTANSGQIDLLLKDGDVEILVEVKTTLRNDDVFDHIERLEKYRRWMDSKGEGKKRYIGALACAMVKDNAVKFAQKNGMYVIMQLGNAIEIVASPEGFVAKEW